MRAHQSALLGAAIVSALTLSAGKSGAQPGPPQQVWIEAESLAPLNGANFSFFTENRQTPNTWSISGPGVAAEWTQGGESEFLSIATRADAPEGTSVSRDIEIPADGDYTLWVRYADYRLKQEDFGVRITQGDQKWEHVFGEKPVVDEMDPMKLYWDWAFGWDHSRISLRKGSARLELYSTGPTEARRQVDALCLTTDENYHPSGREKPDSPAWAALRALRSEGGATPESRSATAPDSWHIGGSAPGFGWNVSEAALDEMRKPEAERIDFLPLLDASLQTDFRAAFAGKVPPVYGDPLSGPTLPISLYPKAFAPNSPFAAWLAAHPDRRFWILLNYGEPRWPKGITVEEKQATYKNFQRVAPQFGGYISGENVSYASLDYTALEARIRAAKSRREVLAILKDSYTAATQAKFSDYSGQPLDANQTWGPVVSCLSANNESMAHALCAWGERRIGEEASGNTANLAHRLAFLRGASRQFGGGMVDYVSNNLGDSATLFSRDSYLYPASSRYILDNQYDAWGGAGVNWLWKNYLLWHLAGADAFYNEQGVDIFWKPAGGAAGDKFPMQLSPKGKIAEAVQHLAREHPRGTQYTPIAFLLDEAHGWAQERYVNGAFGLDPKWNPAVLQPGRHEASIRGWMDVAYFPAPETQNAPADGIHQTFVNGMFGDIFDVIVTAPGKTNIAATYPVLVAAGEINLSEEWGQALRSYLQNGGTLVASADQFTGPGAALLGLKFGATREASSFTWAAGNKVVPSNVFRYDVLDAGEDKVLATAPNGDALCVERVVGKGRIITLGISLGIGIDERPAPLLGFLMQDLTRRVMPLQVDGDLEWTVNRLDDGRWLIGLFNNRGVYKPQHGVTPTRYEEAQTASIHFAFPVHRAEEWIAGDSPVPGVPRNTTGLTLTIPAGGVRMVCVSP